MRKTADWREVSTWKSRLPNYHRSGMIASIHLVQGSNRGLRNGAPGEWSAQKQGGSMSSVSFRKLEKNYGALRIVKGIDLEIADREFVVLVGPSGCGKSTTLRMLAGLESISDGEIRIGDKVVNRLPPRERDKIGRASCRERV